MRREPAFAAAISLCCAALTCAQPQLDRATPQAVRPGRQTILTLHGENLDDADAVWTNLPGRVALVPRASGEPLRCALHVPEDTPPQVAGLVVASPGGCSNTLLVLVDELPSVVEEEKNHSLTEAQLLDWPVAVDGQTNGAAADYFCFDAQAGTQVSIEVVGRRLGSPVDPVIWLRDAAGRELAYADDEPSLGVDCRLHWTCAVAGRYVLELRDNEFRGGLPYRLRIGDFPHVDRLDPLGGAAGKPTTFRAIGRDGPLVDEVTLTLPKPRLGRTIPIGIRRPGGSSSAMFKAAVTELPVCFEDEPNDDARRCPLLAGPCAIGGSIGQPGDRDLYRLRGDGQPWSFRVRTRQLGSPATIDLRLRDASGSLVARAPVAGDGQPQMTATLQRDAEYTLEVAELFQQGGAAYGYWLEAESGPRFSLSLDVPRVKNNRDREKALVDRRRVAVGGAVLLDVECQRVGYEGPIELSASSQHGPLSVSQNVIAAGQRKTRLVVEVPAEFPERLLAVTIEGRGTEKAQRAICHTRDVLQYWWPQLDVLPDWHDGLIFVSVDRPARAPIALRVEPREVELTAGGQCQLQVTAEGPLNKLDDPLLLVVRGLPETAHSDVQPMGDQQSGQYVVTIRSTPQAARGEYNVQVVGYAEIEGVGYRFASEAVTVRAIQLRDSDD